MRFVISIFFIYSYSVCFGQNDKSVRIRVENEFILTSLVKPKRNFKPKSNITYHWCSEQLIKSNRGGYFDELLDSGFKRFDNENNLIQSGEFRKGKKVGPWITWYKNGEISLQSHWRNGREHGRWFYFSEERKNVRTEIWKRGELQKERSNESNKKWFRKFIPKRKEDLSLSREVP